MKINLVRRLALAFAVGLFAHTAQASFISFIYTCTTTGDGGGTQTCTVGDPLVEVQIATTSDPNVLQIFARATPQLLALHDDTDPWNFNITSLLLNLDDAVYGNSGLGDNGLPWYQKNPNNPNPQQDHSTLQFLFTNGVDTLPVSWAGAVAIQVEDNYTNTSPWAGFDLELDTGSGNTNFPLLSDGSLDTFGFIRSGNAFNLLPTMFQFVTENINAPQHPDTVFTASGSDCLGNQQGLYSTIHFEPSNVGVNGCSGHTNYGPWLGAFARSSEPDPPLLPEPGTLALLGVALLGMAWVARRKIG